MTRTRFTWFIKMKVRPGALTGTVKDGAGFYWAVDETREGLKGLAAAYLGVRSGKRGAGGKTVQIWPAEWPGVGMMRKGTPQNSNTPSSMGT